MAQIKKSAEGDTIKANIMALLDQLDQGGKAAAPVEKEEDKKDDNLMEKVLKMLKEMEDDKGIEKEEGEEEDIKKTDDEDKDDLKKADDDEEVKKAEGDEDMGGTKAEDITDEQGEVNDKNIGEVAKAIIMALRKSTVKKSKPTETQMLYKALKAVVDEVAEIKKMNVNLLQGLGVANEIDKLNAVTKSENRMVGKAMNGSNDIQKSLAEIKEMIGGQKEEGNGRFDLHKSLTDNDGALLRVLFGNRK